METLSQALLAQAIQEAQKAEKEGIISSEEKRRYAGEWLYHTDAYQELLELDKLEEAWQVIDLLDEFYREG